MCRRKAPVCRWFSQTLSFFSRVQTHKNEEESQDYRALLLKSKLKQVMVPRSDIIAVHDQASFQEVKKLLQETRFEALPVYHETLDRIVGIIDCQSLLAVSPEENSEETATWLEKIKPAFVAAAAMTLLEGILEIQKRDLPFILIVDEYGGIDGLVSRDTILTAFLNHLTPLEDPLDQEMITYREDGALVVDGRMSLHDFKEKIGIESLEGQVEGNEEIETVGGLVCHLVGRVPMKTEMISHPSGLVFEILDAEPRKIKRLLVKLPHKHDPQHASSSKSV